jgi:hypothetical protein
MALSGLVIGPPRVKWVISMEAERISSASTEYVRFPVFADTAGALANPTGDVVKVALLTNPNTPPITSDWKTAGWDVNVIGGYVAQILVGPNGVTNPGAGTYYTWLQLADGGETVIRQVGQLIID